ncbi:histidine phosphatase family protein [Solidesulfovibrio carbinolicus]|nr:histidine phosphatase family protein [Solidesulfovibrio carbinolicus]
MILYLLRHAATQANRDGLVLGSSDPPALPDALAALATACRPLAGRGIRRIFASPLRRATASAAVLAREVGAPWEILPGLAELSAGIFEGRPRHDVCPPDRPLRRDWTDRPAGGESLADAEARVEQALTAIRPSLDRGPAAVVGHAVVNRVLLQLLYGWPRRELLAFTQPHGVVAEIAATGVVWLDPAPPGPGGRP